MKKTNSKGFTLTEMLITVAIMGLIATAATTLLSTGLQAYSHGSEQSNLYHEGIRAMERMTDRVRRCTFLLIPNAHRPMRKILALSGFINEDNDNYFDDPLFPRIDEDLAFDMNGDSFNGIKGIDDDGNGFIDEFTPELNAEDDDEDGIKNEDSVDGIDNDLDGNIDEDCTGDHHDDGVPGILGMDDDADGLVDEGSVYDDDEDDSLDEVGLIPLLYIFDSGTHELRMEIPYHGTSEILAEHVTSFQATYEAPERILIDLTLTGDNGETLSFSEYVYLRNTYQRVGKRVR